MKQTTKPEKFWKVPQRKPFKDSGTMSIQREFEQSFGRLDTRNSAAGRKTVLSGGYMLVGFD